MATQKAVIVSEIGKPVHLSSRPIPTPKEGEILIRVSSVQLLPHDTYARDKGLFISSHLPYVLGINISGTITRLGPGVTGLEIGARVFGQGSAAAPVPDSAGLQEYSTLRASDCALIPEGFDEDAVATLPTNAVTAFAALFGRGNLAIPIPRGVLGEEKEEKEEEEAAAANIRTFDHASQTLVVIGAGSNVGRLTLQFAKLAGLGRIIAIASTSGTEELLALGATHVVDRHAPDVAAAVHAITSGADAVTLIVDCVSWTYSLAASLASSTRPARIATLHQPATAVAELAALGKGKASAGIAMGTREEFGELAAVFWGRVGEWVRRGQIRPGRFRVVEGLDVERINEALDSYRDGSRVVQAIVHPNGEVVRG